MTKAHLKKRFPVQEVILFFLSCWGEWYVSNYLAFLKWGMQSLGTDIDLRCLVKLKWKAKLVHVVFHIASFSVKHIVATTAETFSIWGISLGNIFSQSSVFKIWTIRLSNNKLLKWEKKTHCSNLFKMFCIQGGVWR